MKLCASAWIFYAMNAFRCTMPFVTLTQGRPSKHDAVGVPFGEELARLTRGLEGQFAESAKSERAIEENLSSLGFDI